MTDNRNLTFEAIDEHIRNADLSALEGATRGMTVATFTADPSAAVAKICEIYQVVRPILEGLLDFPFIPASWKKVIRAFISALDLLCGV